MSEELSAEQLLVRVERQDAAALCELYERYAPRVLGLVARVLPPGGDPDEVLRGVFQRLWSESRSLLHDGASVAAWLIFAARKAALERSPRTGSGAQCSFHVGEAARAENRPVPCLRATTAVVSSSPARKTASASGDAKSATRRPAAIRPGRSGIRPELPLAWFPRPEAIGMVDERLGILHKVINQLPKAQRQALDLVVFSGLGEPEVAVEIREPLGQARARLRAAITFLRHRRRAVLGTWAANI